MPNEPSNTIIYEAVQKLSTNIQDVAESVQGLATHMDERFADVRSEMAYKNSVIATKDDLVNLATKDDLAQLKSEMTSEIDKFVVVHKALDLELVALSSRCNRIEERIR